MAQEILVNVTPQEVRVALLESSILQEIHIERSLYHGLLGNIYKGRVSRLLPGIQAAFIDIGLDRSAFLHISDMVGEEDAGAEDVRKFLTVGQEILVQVYKDQLGTKGARLTTQFTIPSRY
jgi:ribonuclease G